MFLEALREGPAQAFETANEYLAGRSPGEFLEDKKQEIEDELERREQEID
jgi:hypothetical protein